MLQTLCLLASLRHIGAACVEQTGLADCKHPIPLLMDKAQKSEKTNCSNGPQDAKSLEKTIQAQMVIFLAALCVAVVGMAAGAHLLQAHERAELAVGGECRHLCGSHLP